MIRLPLPWSFRLCFVGVLLFFASSVMGQGTRELIDLTPKPPPTTPASTPTLSIPLTQPRIFPSSLPGNAATSAPGLPGLPGAWTPTTIPGNLGTIPTENPLPLAPGLPTALPSSDLIEVQQGDPIQKQLRAAVLEEMTEDEREEQMLQTQRQQAEQILDPDRRRTEMERFQQNETNFRNRLARRQADEAGANVFYFPRLKERLLKDGWCQLFDGQTDFGWKIQTEGPYAGPWKGGKFTFGQDEIGNDPHFPGLVYTQMPFGDVTLRFDYWAEKDSEVFLLLKAPPDVTYLDKECYSFILNSSKSNRPRGLLLGRHDFGLAELRTLRETWDDPQSEAEGTWHSILVKTEENHVQIWIDQRPMAYFVKKPLQPGHIAFLVAKGTARFQNIIWQPTQAMNIFETDNLLGEVPWCTSEGGEFAGTNTTGFRLSAGSVESKDVYANCMLQMQYYQGNDSGRSSLFLRSLPGLKKTGYEISLQNFPKRTDREGKGADAGGFPGVKDARYIRLQQQQWTYLTVLAMDRRIQTWVNGVPVCEIMDQRKVREDTITGPFLEPGTIRLSVSPDNTTFQFRCLSVTPVQ